LRASRANRIFCTDEKRIRTENTVMSKQQNGLWLRLGQTKKSPVSRAFSFNPV